MDDRINDQFSKNSGRADTNRDFTRRNSRAGDFKVSINYDDSFGETSMARSNASQNPDKFKVSIPKEQTPSAASQSAQVRSASKAPQQSPARQTRQTASQKTAPATSRTASNAARKKSTSASGATKPKKETRKKTSSSSSSAKQKLTPTQLAKQKEREKYNRTKRLLTVLTCLIFIAVITTVLSSVALSTINDILAINKKGGETVSVSISEDEANFEDVYDKLCDSGLIKQKFLCKLFCKFRHYDGYYSEKKQEFVNIEYEPGVYYFDTDDTLETMLETIKLSSTVSKDTVRVTFPEGWTIAQIFEKIEKYNVCTAEKLYANLDVVGKQYDFFNDLDTSSSRYLTLEGYLYPDTYDFYIGESASSVIKKLLNNFQNKWTEEYEKKAKQLGMTQDQVIILASIIQREAKNKSQMADISSVLHNRLNDRATYPQLQMNSTKDYITATKEYGVFTDYYYSLYLEAYNTYSAQGLPPGAICNPGNDAINAALNPSDTNYYFFCHDTDGNIYMARTASEHQANVSKIVLAD